MKEFTHPRGTEKDIFAIESCAMSVRVIGTSFPGFFIVEAKTSASESGALTDPETCVLCSEWQKWHFYSNHACSNSFSSKLASTVSNSASF
jgi:hypothetical protein